MFGMQWYVKKIEYLTLSIYYTELYHTFKPTLIDFEILLGFLIFIKIKKLVC
jgi:hypothetical protein